MEHIENFQLYLIQKGSSRPTVKNYVADIRKFIKFQEATNARSFSPSAITSDSIAAYKAHLASLQTSPSSVDRYLSSLRKFTSFLSEKNLLAINPFLVTEEKEADVWELGGFKNALHTQHVSPLTVKNYFLDIKQFLSWIEKVDTNITKDNSISHLTPDVIETYKSRLLSQMELSPLSVNRKLSSIRKYLSYLHAAGHLTTLPQIKNQLETEMIDQSHSEEIIEFPVITETPLSLPETPSLPSSSFAPLRLTQASKKGLNYLFDVIVILPLVTLYSKGSLLFRKSQGKSGLFEVKSRKKSFSSFLPTSERLRELNTFITKNPKQLFKGQISNISKSFYAPLSLSTTEFPLHKKIWHHLRHTRPAWYDKYHSYPLTHYFHFAVLMIVITVVGTGMYSVLFDSGSKNPALAVLPTAPPRILSFQGRLTDSSDNPITTYKNVRFAIYDELAASGSGNLLWQELQGVTPDEDGVFSVLMGNTVTTCANPLTEATGPCAIPSTLFTENATLYLGVTIENDSELTPRQQVATVAYATNSETLQGLPPSTAAGAATSNVVLALDSTGNLTIGGSATPTFQASGGQFTLSGTVLNLTTTAGSNSNIVLNPDGFGKIDAQDPFINSSLTSTLTTAAGAVMVDDLFAINATSSGQSAFTLNQDGAGPLISASASGVAKFTVGNTGTGYFAGNVGIGTTTTTVPLSVAGASGGNIIAITPGTGAASDVGYLAVNLRARFGYDGSGILIDDGGTTKSLNVTLGGSNRFHINSTSGNIGIGTTTTTSFKVETGGSIGPTLDATYDLGSATKRWNNLYAVNIIGGTSGTQGFWQLNNGAISPANSTNDLLLGATATTSARFAFINNIGSGTPTASISGNLAIAVPTGSNPATTYSAFNGGSINFQTSVGGDAGLATKLTLLNNGNVGIGTTTPLSLLHVNAADTVTGTLTIGGGKVTVSGVDEIHSQLDFRQNDSSMTSTNQIGGRIASISEIANGAYAGLAFYTGMQGRTSVLQEALRISYNGNVGIGTTAPFGKLNVVGVAADPIGKAALAIIQNETNGDLFTASAGATTRFVIKNDGNVGVNDNTPDASLSVGGNIIARIAADVNSTRGIQLIPAAFNGQQYIRSWGNSGGALNITGSSTGTGSDGAIVTINPLGVVSFSTSPSTTGVERMRIDSAGNVGIGTTTPTSLFEVVGGTTGGKAALIVNQTGASTNDILTASASGTTRFVINNAGNVGIGTSLPAQLFDVSGGSGIVGQFSGRVIGGSAVNSNEFITLSQLTSATYWQRLLGTLSPANITDDLLLGGTSTASAKFAFINNIGSGSPTATISGNLSLVVPTGSNPANTFNLLNGGSLNFQSALTGQGDGALTSRLFIKNDGNIGIGVTNPSSALAVNGVNSEIRAGITTSTGQFGVIGVTRRANYGDIMFSRNLEGVSGSDNYQTIGTLASTGYNGIEFKYGGDTYFYSQDGNTTAATTVSPVSRLTIKGDTGNVGIGTTTPFGKLNVVGAAATPIGKSALVVIQNETNGDLFTASAGATTRFVINNAGNVGIGSTTPAQVLDVVGNALISGNIGLGTTTVTSLLNINNSAGGVEIQGINENAFNLYTDGSFIFRLDSDNDTTNTYAFYNGANSEIASLDESGNLQLDGNLDVDGTLTAGTANAFVVNASGQITTTTDETINGIDISSGAVSDITTLATTGVVTFANYTTNGGLLYTNGSGVVSQTTAGGSGECLQSIGGGAPTWGTCGSGSKWTITSGAIHPNNLTLDGFIGGNSTASADFAFINVDSGNPTASIAANLAIASPTGANPATTYSAFNGGSINFRTSVGGDTGATSRLFIANLGNVGVGTTNPGQELDVNGDILTGVNSTIDVRAAGSLGIGTATQTGLTVGRTGATTTINGGSSSVIDFGNFDVTAAGLVTTADDVAINGGDITTSQSSFNLLNATATSINFAGGATGTLAIGNTSGTTNLLGANVRLGDTSNGINVTSAGIISDLNGNVTVQDHLVPQADNTYDLGTTSLQWRTIYAGTSICFTGGTDCTSSFSSLGVNYWNIASGTLQPKNSTLDLLIGGTATTSADFAFINVDSGNPTASIAANLAIASPTGANPATTYSAFNGGSINFRTSVGGDTGATSRLFIANLGNVGIGSTSPTQALDVVGNITLNGTTGLALTGSDADLTFSGASNHDITASSGTLRIGAASLTGTLNANSNTITNATSYNGLVVTANTGVITTGTWNGTAVGATYGGTGINTSGSTGVPYITSGTWSVDTNSLTAPHGGTGQTIYATGDMLYASSTTALSKLTIGSTGQALTVSGGLPAWANTNTSAFGLWDQASGVINPKNSTLDLLVGGSATTSAKFGLINVNSGTPTATISGNLAIAAPTGSNPATSYSAFNGGSINFKTSVGGDSGATSRLYIENLGNIGVGTTTLDRKMSVAGDFIAGGTTTGLIMTGTTLTSGFYPGASVVDHDMIIKNGTINGNIFFQTGSATTRLAIDSLGILTASAYTTNGGLLYTNGSGVFSQTAAGSSGECLKSNGGGAPTWITCPTGSKWTITAGGIHPNNSTLDLFIGGTATASSKFAFINVNSGTPTFRAYNSTSAQYISMNHDGTDGNITASTGTINIGQGGGTLYLETDIKNDTTNYSGFVQISDKLFVQGPTEASANSLAIFDNTTAGADILTASSAGTTRFVLTGAGNVGIGTNLPRASLEVVGDASASGSLVLRNASSNQIESMNGSPLSFWTSVGGDAGLTERLRITSDGNIGINSTSPTTGYILDAVGRGRFSTGLSVGTTATTNTFELVGTMNQATGQVTFGGNVDATSGVDVTGASLTVGGANFSVTTAGLVTTADDIAVNGGDITTTASTFNLVNATATSVNFAGGATGTLAIGNTSGTTNLLGANVRLGSSSTGINITSAGLLTDIDGNVVVQDHIVPQANNTYDLGTASLQWKDYYGVGTAYSADFKDTNNTAYYLDPASTTDSLIVNGHIRTGGSSTGTGGVTLEDNEQEGVAGTIKNGAGRNNLLATAGYVMSPFGGFGRYENYLRYSEQFDNQGFWARSGLSVVANAVQGPNSQDSAIATADVISDDGTPNGTLTQSYPGTITGSEVWTFSVWLRNVRAAESSYQAATGNVILSLVSNGAGASAATTTIAVPSTSWKRYSVTYTVNGTSPTALIAQFDYQGGASTEVAVWGAQLEKQAAPSVYAQTTDSFIPTGRGLVATGVGPHLLQTGNGGTATPSATGLFLSASGGVYQTHQNKNIFEVYNSDASATNNTSSIGFLTNRAGNTATQIASVSAIMTDATATAYTGALTFSTMTSAGTGPTEKLRIAGNGNVGIGTTAPANKLSVNGAASFGTYAATAAPSNGIIVSGNVGIGTSTAGSELTVMSTATYGQGITIASDGTGEQAGIGFKSAGTQKWQLGKNLDDSFYLYDEAAARTDLSITSNGNMFLMGNGGNVGIGTSTAGNLFAVNGAASFGTYAATAAPSNGMIVSGNVGIGTSTVNAKLSLSNNVATSFLDTYSEYQILIHDGASATASYGLGINTNTMVFNSGGGAYRFDRAGNATTMTLDTAGNIGIGTTTTSSYKLDVNGGIRSLDYGAAGTANILIGDDTFLTDIDTSNAVALYGVSDNTKGCLRLGSTSGQELCGSSGNIGIGTTAARRKLSQVYTCDGCSSTSFVNYHTDDDSNQGVLLLGIGTASTGTGTRFIKFFAGIDDGTDDYAQASADGVGNIHINNNSLVFDTTGVADFGEYMEMGEIVEAGDIIAETNNKGKKAKGVDHAIGVISRTTSFLGNSRISDNPNTDIVGYVGQIQTKVSTVNGAIHRGDRITTSNIPGTGEKATKAGQIIGVALEDFDPNNSSQAISCPSGTSSDISCGKIMLYVNPSWYDPDVYITNAGDLNVSFENNQFVARNEGSLVTRIGSFATAVIANLKAGAIQAQSLTISGLSTLSSVTAQTITVSGNLTTSSLSVATNSITIAGQSLTEYIDSRISNAIDSGQLVSPLASDSATVRSGKVVIKPLIATTEPVLEVEGNASVSGQLSTNSLTTTDATVSGTLRVDTLIADNLTALEAQVASLSAGSTEIPPPSEESIASFIATGIQSQYADIASLSAGVAFVPDLKTDFLQVNQGLIALAPSSLSDTSITGQLSINGSLILSENSVNVLGADFNIQPLRQGGVSFEGGLITMDTDGNLYTAGNAAFAKNVTVGGNLATNFLSPIPGNDLEITLPATSTQLAQGTGSSLVVKNASGSGVLSINQLGDLVASGAGQFKELAASSLNIVRGAQADTSFNETIASGSAGTGIVNAYYTERTIVSPFVTEDSLIYITPTSDTNGITPYVSRQIAQDDENGIKGSFTVTIPQTSTSDIKFNWWIVN